MGTPLLWYDTKDTTAPPHWVNLQETQTLGSSMGLGREQGLGFKRVVRALSPEIVYSLPTRGQLTSPLFFFPSSNFHV